MKPYNPHKDQINILDMAYNFVESVPYTVTARWLFYRLLQEGIYAEKNDYKGKFLPLLSKARKAFYKNWRPDTLADDTREALIRGDGFESYYDWLKAIGKAKCSLDKWYNQSHYIELWFEAKAMKGQFEHYTKHITLRPFGGDASISFKWDTAQELSTAYQRYKKPIVILYFGDLDPKGLQIPESAVRDIRAWCDIDFEFYRCGLNPGDESKFNITENFEKPGTYQWEALTDKDAQELITSWTRQFVSQGYFEDTIFREKQINQRFQTVWQEFLSTQS